MSQRLFIRIHQTVFRMNLFRQRTAGNLASSGFQPVREHIDMTGSGVTPVRGLGKDMDQLLGIDRFRETREGPLGHRRPDSIEQMTGHENDGQLRPHHLTLAQKIEAIEVRHM